MIDYKTITKKDFEILLMNSKSKSDLCRAFNFSTNKWNMDKVMLLVKRFEFNTNHFGPKLRKRKYAHVIEICPRCGDEYERVVGSKKRDRKACSKECYNKFFKTGEKNNKWKEKKKCEMCEEKVKKNATRFCSFKCSARFLRIQTFKKIENGTFKRTSKGNSKNKYLKLYLIEKHGHKCMICNLTEWLGKPIPLQLDHKDGNSENDKVENIRNICPNCHAQTPTYCGKNKGKGKRKHRLDDYYSGKKKW